MENREYTGNFTFDKNCLIECGRGEPLIMLHGYMSSKEAFLSQIEFFSRYFRVYALDLKGFGNNVPMPYAYSLSDYVDEFNEFVRALNQRVYVLAHSFGCRIAIRAMSSGTLVKKAVLCGVAGLKPRFSLKREIRKLAYKTARPFFDRDTLEKRFFSSDYNLADGVMKKSFKKIVGEYLDDDLKNIQCPVLCVFGENDRETPPYLAARITKNLPTAKTEVIADSGHFCFVEKSTEFNYKVREFLL